ncbi:MAG: 6-phosphogluconolactonase [Desulfobacteraceae bacterium]|jgi:6-phosphogluconolactonase|nr:6-phosphogluconolactonase [Desulfobacteraceae bacterium]
MHGKTKVNLFADRDALSAALSAHVVCLAAMATAERGRFYVALSGGSLMNIISPSLGSPPLRDTVNWSAWHVFWVDERWVPWRSPDSNYGLARRQFFNRVSIPGEQIHAAAASLSPTATAQTYESTLAEVFQHGAGRLPRFDLMLLGIGEDGHTASLFPGHPALNENRRWVVPVLDAPKPPPVRMTMTLPVINNARHVVFVAAGPGKAKILSKVLNSQVPQPELPARRVNPSNGELQWFIDRAAAAQI